MFYWLLKWVLLGPLLKLVFRPQTEGAENVPAEGAAILASNHLSYADWLFMPLTLPRRVTFVAKAEYFTTPGIKGWFQKKFFSGAGQVPIDRSGATAAEGALKAAKRILGEGEPVRDLPRGHPLARRPALPRQDRRRPAGAGDQGAGDPGRRRRHRRGGPARQEVRRRHPAGGAVRRAAGLLPLRGPRERPLHPAVDHRRDHVRDHAALRPGVRRHVRHPRQGARQGVEEARAAPARRRRAGHRRDPGATGLKAS